MMRPPGAGGGGGQGGAVVDRMVVVGQGEVPFTRGNQVTMI